MDFPDKKYDIIYADPPWNFRVYSDKGKGRSAENHYPIMNLYDIKTMNVQSITEDDCILFLWATYPNLRGALEVIDAWDFTYKTVGFTWIKENKKSPGFFMGLGYWTRANPEICLLATKGRPKRINKSVRNLVVSPLREHSRKPDEVRNRIVELCGNISRIELFARDRYDGWDAWGNEIGDTL